MIFDDHEIIDDWNISDTWRADIAARRGGPPGSRRARHLLGLPAPGQHPAAELEKDPVYQAVPPPATPPSVLDEFGGSTRGRRWRTTPALRAYRWSYSLDLGRTRVVVLDNRAGRQLEPGRRAMCVRRDWAWLQDAVARRPRPRRDRLLAAVAAAARRAPPGGGEREAHRVAPAVGARGPRRSAGGSTWSTGPRSAGRSTRMAELLTGVANRRRVARPPVACSPATCTTPTWRRPTAHAAARSTSSPARPCTTRCPGS